MTIWKRTAAIIGAIVLFGCFFLVACIMDMAMEGHTLAYPHIGYTVPSILLSILLLPLTHVMKKRDPLLLKHVGVYFFLIAVVFTIVISPVLPIVCYGDSSYAMLARICYTVNAFLPIIWIV